MNTPPPIVQTVFPQRLHKIAAYAAPFAFYVIVVALCGWALGRGIQTTWNCQWPAEWDTLRDMGMAQTLLDGRYPEDPILSGETLWYNPLTGAMLAVASRVSDMTLYRASIVIGPYVNMLAPIAFVVLLLWLFGRAAALAGLCVLLFAKNPQTVFWVQACYSPWLLAPLYSLGLFFLTLALYYRALSSQSLGRFCLAGILLGITFMAHTAPALVAGGVMTLTLLIETIILWRSARLQEKDGRADGEQSASRQWRRIPIYFMALLCIAFFVSLPYTWSILWNYRFQVQNPFPSLYAADYVALNHLPDRLREAVNCRNAVALVGLVALVWRSRRTQAARFVLCWSAVTAAFTVQHYVWQALLARGVVLSSLVPGHHAAIHLSAARAALFAVGATALGSGFAHGALRLLRAKSKTKMSPAKEETFRYIGAGLGALLAGLSLYAANPLTTRIDFLPPDKALYHQFHEQGIPMYHWILENTTPDAVFLCDEETIGMTVVMPAGRKLVAAMLLYSNPYVSPSPLFDAQGALFDAIERGDRTAFCRKAAQYPGLYLLVREETAQAQADRFSVFFEKQAQAGGLVVWRARECPEPANSI